MREKIGRMKLYEPAEFIWTFLRDRLEFRPCRRACHLLDAPHGAAENDHLAVVKLLVSKGANVAYKGEYTALQLAEMAEHDEVVVYLKTL
jgi:hypothetical protein